MESHYWRKTKLWLVIALAIAMLLGMMPAVAGAADPPEYAFVPNAFEASVSKVHLNAVPPVEVARYSTIPVRPGPYALADYRVSRLAVEPTLGNAWALNSMTGQLTTAYNAQASVARISSLPVGADNTSTSGGLAGIVLPDDRVTYFDIGDPGDCPRTILVSEEGDEVYLWIGYYLGNYFQKYHYTGTALEVVEGARIDLNGYTPYSAVLDKDGIMWVVSRNANPFPTPVGTPGVLTFDTNDLGAGYQVLPYDLPGKSGENPYAIIVDSEGRVWVSDGSNWSTNQSRYFAVYTYGTPTTVQYVTSGSSQAMRGFVEVDGVIWATTITGQILKGTYNAGDPNHGWTFTQVLSGLGELAGIGTDASGDMWVVGHGTDKLYRFDPANPAGGTTATVAVGDGPYAYGNFVSRPQPAALGDFVWYDADMDGVQDERELGIAGVTVNLYDGVGTLLDSAVTDADGYYQFAPLDPGSYQVEFVLPTGYAFSPQDQGADDGLDSDPDKVTGKTVVTVLESGEADMSWDAGMYELACIGDFVWEDMDADGIQDANEVGIPGVTVNLYDSANALVGTTATDANGKYEFCDLVPGDYHVGFVLPATYVFSPQDQGGDDAKDSDADVTTGLTAVTTLTPGENDVAWDAGMFRNATKSGYKWHDWDADKTWDEGEPGLGGWTIEVYEGATLKASTMTAADGSYSFILKPGSYTVKEVSQTDWYQSYPDIPGDGDWDITLTSGQNDTGNNFGNYQKIKISGFKWNDLDGDGGWFDDPSEPRLSGWTIELWQGGSKIDETTTLADPLGYYEFTDLMPGDYVVKEVLKTGWTQTFPPAGDPWYSVWTLSGLVSGDNPGNIAFGNMQPETTTSTLLYKKVGEIGGGDDVALPPGSTMMLGDEIYDTATVTSDGGTPTGSVQFQYKKSGDASWTPLGGAVPLDGGEATSTAIALPSEGTWYFQAVYTPTGPFLPSESGATAEPIVVLYEDLTVSKTVETSYDLLHKWDIDKWVETENGYTVDEDTPKIWLYTDGSGDETATWHVDVEYVGSETMNFEIHGTITIHNSGTQDAMIISLEDVLAGTAVPVTWSWPAGTELPYLLEVDETLTGTYVGDISEMVEGKNVIKVITEVDEYSGEADIEWGEPEEEINKTVHIKDISDLFGEVDLGTVTATDDGHFTYDEEFTYAGYASKGEHQAYYNTASIVETGQYATALLKVNAQQLKWETAWRFGNIEHDDIIKTNNWGWSDGPLAQRETAYRQLLYAGAGQNDITKGTVVGYVDVLYWNNEVTVTYVCDPGCLLREVHLWVGKTALPTKGKGMTNAPGQLGWPNKKAKGEWIGTPGAYTGWTITLDAGKFTTTNDGKIYVAAHSVAGVPDPFFGPQD